MFGHDGKVRSLLYPQAREKRYIVDPVAFTLAMIGGPVLVTLMSFWVLGIPVAALILGGPLFVVIGTPVLLWHLSRHTPKICRISLLSLFGFATLSAVVAAVAGLTGQSDKVFSAVWFVFFGCVFAPLWGAMTGRIYIRLRRDFYVYPVHV